MVAEILNCISLGFFFLLIGSFSFLWKRKTMQLIHSFKEIRKMFSAFLSSYPQGLHSLYNLLFLSVPSDNNHIHFCWKWSCELNSRIIARNEVSRVFQVFFLFPSATKLYCQNSARYWFSVGNQINCRHYMSITFHAPPKE